MPVVWLVNHYAQAPTGSGGTRHYSLARQLYQSCEWETYIIASSCSYSTGKQRLPGFRSSLLECIDGVNFLWLRIPFEPSALYLLRFLSMILFSIRVLSLSIMCKLPRPDVVIGSTVHPFAALAGSFLAFRYRVPFVFEVRDLWPATLVAMEIIRPAGFFERLLAQLERWLADMASLIIVLMPGGVTYYNNLGIPPHRLLWLPNGSDVDQRQTIPNRLQPLPFQLFYLGSLGPANSLDDLIQAMILLKDRGIDSSLFQLRLYGSGPSKDALKNKVSLSRLDFVFFEDPVPRQSIPALASQADAFVVCMQNLPHLYRHGISFNKLFDYFQAGRPIVSASCAAHDPVLAADAGIVVPAGDPTALADAIDKLRQLPFQDRQRLGANGLAYLKAHHTYSLLAQRLANALNVLLHRDDRR